MSANGHRIYFCAVCNVFDDAAYDVPLSPVLTDSAVSDKASSATSSVETLGSLEDDFIYLCRT